MLEAASIGSMGKKAEPIESIQVPFYRHEDLYVIELILDCHSDS